MTDREKVIKGIECHRKKVQTTNSVSCLECPYSEPKPIREWCMSGLMDALALLKEQNPKHGHWIEGLEALPYDGVYGDDYIVCSECKKAFCIMDNCTEEFDFCPHCGADMRGEME